MAKVSVRVVEVDELEDHLGTMVGFWGCGIHVVPLRFEGGEDAWGLATGPITVTYEYLGDWIDAEHIHLEQYAGSRTVSEMRRATIMIENTSKGCFFFCMNTHIW